MTIESFLKYTEKKAGATVARPASQKARQPHVPFGIFILDFALGGGIQENAIHTFIGHQSSGKTTASMKLIANFQKKYNGVNAPLIGYDGEVRPKRCCVFIDAEHTFDPVWAAANGVDLEALILVDPIDGDMAVEIACAAMEDEDVCLVVLDSIPALVTTRELEKTVDEAMVAPLANIVQRFMRKASHAIAIGANTGQHKTLICINQWRQKVGGYAPNGQVPKSMPGGVAQRYFVSTEIEFMNKKQIEGVNDDNIRITSHNEMAFKLIKNKTGCSIQDGEFELARFSNDKQTIGQVLDEHTVVTYSQNYGMVGGAGAGWWYVHPETGEVIKTKSKSAITEALENDQELKQRLAIECIKKLRVSQGQEANPYF